MTYQNKQDDCSASSHLIKAVAYILYIVLPDNGIHRVCQCQPDWRGGLPAARPSAHLRVVASNAMGVSGSSSRCEASKAESRREGMLGAIPSRICAEAQMLFCMRIKPENQPYGMIANGAAAYGQGI